MIAAIEFYEKYMTHFKLSITSVLAILIVVLVILAILLFIYRRYLILRSNVKEYWLPIVDDAGRVIGRVARSVSLENPGLYQHPLIRILTLKSGSIYLTPRTYEICPDVGRLDHPFEDMMEYGSTMDEVLDKMQKAYFPNSKHPRFLLRYKHENAIGNWQVFLYQLDIEDENELIGLDKSKGRFWTIQQVKENVGMSFLSAILEGEIDFLETLHQD